MQELFVHSFNVYMMCGIQTLKRAYLFIFCLCKLELSFFKQFVALRNATRKNQLFANSK
jgi:hypothetical protein